MNEVICSECEELFELTWPGVDATMTIEWTVAGPQKVIVTCPHCHHAERVLPDDNEDSVLKQLGV